MWVDHPLLTIRLLISRMSTNFELLKYCKPYRLRVKTQPAQGTQIRNTNRLTDSYIYRLIDHLIVHDDAPVPFYLLCGGFCFWLAFCLCLPLTSSYNFLSRLCKSFFAKTQNSLLFHKNVEKHSVYRQYQTLHLAFYCYLSIPSTKSSSLTRSRSSLPSGGT